MFCYRYCNLDYLKLYHNYASNVYVVDILGIIDDKIEANEKTAAALCLLGAKIYDKIQSVKTTSVSLDTLLQFTNGHAFKTQTYIANGDYRVITIKNIADSGFSANNAERIEFKLEYKNFVLSVGDILLTMTGEVGRVGIVDCDNCLLNQRVLKVTGKSAFFTYFCLSANEQQIKLLAKGSVQQNLGLKELSAYHIGFANWNEYRRHDWIIEKLLSLTAETQKLTALKSAYLKKFFG